MSENVYKIPIKTFNISKPMPMYKKITSSTNKRMHNIDSKQANNKIISSNKNEKNNDGLGGIGGGGDGFINDNTKSVINTGIINSVENFQIIPKQLNSDQKNNNDMNVLQEPPGMKIKSSTASSGTRKTSEVENKMLAPMAAIPTVTPENKQASSTQSKLSPLKILQKPVPIGVVPIPNIPNDFAKNNDDGPSLNHHIESNRYLNIIDNNDAINNKESILNKRDNFQNANEIENGAHEINDNNDFNIDDTKNHRDHMQDVLNDEKLNNLNGNNVINNAAEEDTNIYDNKNDNVDLEIIKRGHNANNNNKFVNDKLMNEIAGDQGKDYAEEMREDLHMEEQGEDEDGKCFVIMYL